MKMRLKHISRIGVLVCVLGVFTSSAQNLPPASADADIRILLDEQRYVFDDHAAATHTWRTVYQLLTPAAVRNAMVEVAWEPWHEQRPTIKASVITKDGKRHDLDQATIGDAPAPTNMPDIFTDRRILQAPLPAVDVGAVVEEEIVSRETAPSFDRGVIHFMQFTRTGAPVDRARLIIEHTASTPIHYASRSLSNIEPRRTETRGHTQLVFEAGPFEALKPLNPFVAPDQGLPSFVMFTTGSSWKDVASRYSEIVDQQIGRSDVSALVRGLAGKSRLEIAAELLSRLQREVRYTGVEYGDASFVPRPPEETLRRKYGDCKDKAALLVAMLRQSGIPAYIALLTVNPEFDALPELPGMGWFSHAIVYVPGAPDLWIDPTFEFGRAGQLHAGEQGRLALIARPESDGLIRTPESSSSDNTSVETREIYLPESGAARVVETTELSGALEQELRAYYASSGTDGVRAQLEKYVKSYYQAAELSALDVPSPNDLEHSFRMRLEARNSGIGRAGADDAVVVIPQAQLVDRFSGFIESFDADSKWTMRDAQDVIIPDPFVTEWRYRIVPPPGFGARPLPSAETKRMGPAIFTTSFTTGADGTVTAIFRFDSGKRRLNLTELQDLRKGVAELLDSQPIMIGFDQIGESHLSAGRLREALEEFRKLEALHPTEALHHGQVAKALLSAGAGTTAREEAKRGIELEPSSAAAHEALGIVLEHDLIGRLLKNGADLKGAEAEFRKAKELDPKSLTAAASLAILLEHNDVGERYGNGARMEEAIVEYRSIQTAAASTGLADNLPIALTWAGKYREARELLQALPSTRIRQAYIIAATAALDGAPAAIRDADRINATEDGRREILSTAGDLLLNQRHYKEAAELLTAASRGSRDAATLLGRANIIARTRKHEELTYSADDPATAIKKLYIILFSGDVQKEALTRVLSRYSIAGFDAHAADLRQMSRSLRSSFQSLGSTPEVGVDLILSALEFSREGDEQTGFKLTARSLTGGPTSYYVEREDGEYRVISVIGSAGDIGRDILARLERRDLEGARRWLDWVREDQGPQVEDPIADPLFSRFWDKGQKGGAEEMKYAAAALLADVPDAADGLDILKQGRAKATSDLWRLNFDVALARAYFVRKQFPELLPVGRRILQLFPNSETALSWVVVSLERTNQFKEAERIAQERLRRFPNDPWSLRWLVALALVQDQVDKMEGYSKQLIASGKASPGDMNNAAWYALIRGSVTSDAIRLAQQSAQLNGNKSAAPLHTLAALYAETGETSQARDLLLRSLELRGSEEPESDDWYVLGRIAEQIGIREAALAAYNKVLKPKEDYRIGAYALAQRRLNAMAN